MEVNGREIHFFRNVFANCLIVEASPEGDADRFFKECIYDVSNYAKAQKACATLMEALSKGYEFAEQTKDPAYKPRPLTQMEALCLPTETFNILFVEASKAWINDGKVTVETAPPKGKKTAKERSS